MFVTREQFETREIERAKLSAFRPLTGESMVTLRRRIDAGLLKAHKDKSGRLFIYAEDALAYLDLAQPRKPDFANMQACRRMEVARAAKKNKIAQK